MKYYKSVIQYENIFEEDTMGPKEALKLVREKYLEEMKDIKEGETAEKYHQACREYPAMMSIVHFVWAKELSRDWPTNA